MKTKFSDILKIKKQTVEKIERNIQKINSSIQMLQNKINSLNNELSSFSFPHDGDFRQFQQIKLMQENLINEIKNFENQIKILENRKNELMEELKKANIEYEKIKYLHELEIQKILKKRKQKENQEMDEIAILLRKKYNK